MSSGHSRESPELEKCELCGDKDYMADKFCGGNLEVAEQRKEWLEELRGQEHSAATEIKMNSDDYNEYLKELVDAMPLGQSIIGIDWAKDSGMSRGDIIKREDNVVYTRFKTVGA